MKPRGFNSGVIRNFITMTQTQLTFKYLCDTLSVDKLFEYGLNGVLEVKDIENFELNEEEKPMEELVII